MSYPGHYDDDDDPYIVLGEEYWLNRFMSRDIYWDSRQHDFACRCPHYRKEKKCVHLWRLRRQVDVPVDPKYL